MTTESHTIRAAGFEDVQAVFELVKEYPEELLPRPVSDIVQNLDRFIVCVRGGKVIGTVSWQILPEIGSHRPTVEIKSLAIRRSCQKSGIGRSLVNAAMERIKPLHPSQVIVLTFAPDFFKKLGFEEISKEKLIHKIYTGCLNCTKYDSPFTCPETALSLKM
ncbi:GNAT family N-acetyltransferase [Verrucomicrobiota bacterium]